LFCPQFVLSILGGKYELRQKRLFSTVTHKTTNNEHTTTTIFPTKHAFPAALKFAGIK
jgi:hypothetical protein